MSRILYNFSIHSEPEVMHVDSSVLEISAKTIAQENLKSWSHPLGMSSHLPALGAEDRGEERHLLVISKQLILESHNEL